MNNKASFLAPCTGKETGKEMDNMKLDVFGKLVQVTRVNDKWSVYYCGTEGKKRLATDIVLPDNLPRSEVAEYIADLCHEWATPTNPSVSLLTETKNSSEMPIAQTKIAVAQISSVKGDIEANVKTHIQAIETAAEHGVSYLVFPELSLTGYEPEMAASIAFKPGDERLHPIIETCVKNRITVGVGAPLHTHGLPQIGLLIVSNTGAIDTYSKMYLHPGEEAYFSKGDSHHILKLPGITIGNGICADTNHPEHARGCSQLGADVYIAGVLISAAGYRSDTDTLQQSASDFGLLVAIANHNAPTGEWVPAGKSAIWTGSGQLISAGEQQDAILVAERKLNGWSGQLVPLP